MQAVSPWAVTHTLDVLMQLLGLCAKPAAVAATTSLFAYGATVVVLKLRRFVEARERAS